MRIEIDYLLRRYKLTVNNLEHFTNSFFYEGKKEHDYIGKINSEILKMIGIWEVILHEKGFPEIDDIELNERNANVYLFKEQNYNLKTLKRRIKVARKALESVKTKYNESEGE